MLNNFFYVDSAVNSGESFETSLSWWGYFGYVCFQNLADGYICFHEGGGCQFSSYCLGGCGFNVKYSEEGFSQGSFKSFRVLFCICVVKEVGQRLIVRDGSGLS